MWRILRVCSSAKTRLFKSLDSRHLVTAHDIETFQTQGVVCLRGAFREWVEKLKKGIATNHANPSSDRGEWIKSEDSQTFYFNDYFNWRRIPEFEEFVRLSPAAEIAGKLMKSEVCFVAKRFAWGLAAQSHLRKVLVLQKKKGVWVNKLCPIPIEDMQFHLTSNITDFMVCCQATWPLFLLPGILFAHGAFHILSPTPLY